MNPALRRATAHVFVESLEAPQLRPEDDHHLRRVLRLRTGDAITLSDGVGAWRQASLQSDGVRIEGERVVEPDPARAIVLTAIPKGDRLEWMVQKATELGATAIGFVDCARSVVRWDAERQAKQIERLQRIVREASMQSRRAWLPQLLGVMPFAVAATRGDVAVADIDGDPVLPSDVAAVLIGPEGGFTDAEAARVERRVSLAHNVLRVETAAIASVVMLTQRHESR